MSLILLPLCVYNWIYHQNKIGKLKTAAHNSLRDLTEDGVDTGSAKTAIQNYEDKISEIIGDAKAQQLLQLLNDRYKVSYKLHLPA